MNSVVKLPASPPPTATCGVTRWLILVLAVVLFADAAFAMLPTGPAFPSGSYLFDDPPDPAGRNAWRLMNGNQPFRVHDAPTRTGDAVLTSNPMAGARLG